MQEIKPKKENYFQVSNVLRVFVFSPIYFFIFQFISSPIEVIITRRKTKMNSHFLFKLNYLFTKKNWRLNIRFG